MIDALQTATTGMTRATDRLGTAAQTIAASGAPLGDAPCRPPRRWTCRVPPPI